MTAGHATTAGLRRGRAAAAALVALAGFGCGHSAADAAPAPAPAPRRATPHRFVAAVAAPAPAADTVARHFGLPLIPFSEKRGGELRGVHVGWWPAERRAMGDAYANPAGFVAVTPWTRHVALSPHLTLGELAMRDGAPDGHGADTLGYAVVRDALVTKLELVIAGVARRTGRPADLRVLSGFRAPSHNARVEGAAESSRHQFGDAADVVLDADGDGRMDDLTGDGRIDLADARVVVDVVEQVERERPELTGGVGIYAGSRGPFLHIDARGRRARWARVGGVARAAVRIASSARAAAGGGEAAARPAQCAATGASAVLCTTRRGLLAR